MKKYLVYLLFMVALPIVVSCSKDDEGPELISGESKISKDTGISFMNASGFDADRVVFMLKSGNGPEKEYGQSLEGFNITKLHAGSKTIYQMKVYRDGDPIPFSAFMNDADGNKIAVQSTTVVQIMENELFTIMLENQE